MLVDAVKTWLDAPEQRGRSAFVVLHTQGSHYVFPDRYPETFRRFSGASDEHQRLIDSYDNTIAYTDFVLDSLIGVLEADKRPAALLYVADHGENLRDDERNLFGHFICNDKDIPIPMLLWFSKSLAKVEGERMEATRSHLSRRVSTTAVFDTLLDLGGVSIERGTTASRSLVRPTFRESPRLVVTNDGRIIDFDAKYRSRRALP